MAGEAYDGLWRGKITQQRYHGAQDQAAERCCQPQAAGSEQLPGGIQGKQAYAAEQKDEDGENDLHGNSADAGHNQVQNKKGDGDKEQYGHDLLKKTITGLIVIHNRIPPGNFLHFTTVFPPLQPYFLSAGKL